MNDTVANFWTHRAGRLLAALSVGALSLAAGCSGDDGGGQGDSCSSNSDCKAGFVCSADKCVERSANNGGPDAGGDGGGNNGTVEPEDYYISYQLENPSDNTTTLHVLSTADGTDTQVTPDGDSCTDGCWLSEDMSYYVWAQDSASGAAGTLDVYKAAVSNLQVQGDAQMVVEGASVARVAGNVVTYSKESGGQYTAYYQDLDGGSETTVGSLGSSGTTLGGWFLDPATNTSMVYLPQIQNLDIKMGTLDGPAGETTYTVNAENYQQTSGSYFGSSMPVSVSPDGKLAAFVTRAPNDYGECSTAADCSGPVKKCGRYGRCTAIEVTVHIMDLEHLGDLGGPCGGPGTCGDIHECYQPGSDTTNAKCIPKRVVLGVPNQPFQPGGAGQAPKSGCELTTDNAEYHYTNQHGPLSFDNSGNIYTVAQRNCPNEADVGDSDIIKINATSGDFEVVWGNPSAGFDPNACWDTENQEPSDDQCQPYISEARLSPGHNELAFTATNPWVSESSLAPQILDLWSVLRNGEGHAWIGAHDIVQATGQPSVVKSFAVHPMP